MNRRDFLRRASAASLLPITGLGSSLMSMPALAANTSGYRALVCLFLFGGMDNHDTILPYDAVSYDQFAGIRGTLLDQYRGNGNGRDRADLLALSPDNAANFNGRSFALPPEMSELHSLFQAGNAAIAGNVGPLLQATDRAVFEQGQNLPRRLFSHNDQQSTWMALQPEGAREGWGGRFADAALNSNANMAPIFTSLTTFGDSVWLSGEVARQYQLSLDGVPQLLPLEYPPFFGVDDFQMQALIEDHFRQANYTPSNLFERDVANAMRGSLDANEQYAAAQGQAPTLTTQFPQGFLGQQLRSVAESIALKDLLGQSRQIFFVGFGGFDTHSGQAADLPGLQRQISAGIGAFHAAMVELGLADEVTLFTTSDFGRTLTVNGDGTDHGWGGHSFVVGGGVNGRNIFGDLPPPVLDHDQDSGNGRLIPTTSVEQFAAPLGRWFGLTDSELAIALPGLVGFPGNGVPIV